MKGDEEFQECRPASFTFTGFTTTFRSKTTGHGIRTRLVWSHCKLKVPGRPAPQIIPKPAPLCRDAHVHLIAHATITPSPYQDSLRRDGAGKRVGSWVRARVRDIMHHWACHFVSESVSQNVYTHPKCSLAIRLNRECRPAIFGKGFVTL